MRVVTLSAMIVSATATASCARRCGVTCRATTTPKQVPYGGAYQPPITYGGGIQPGFPYPQPPFYGPQPGFPYPQPGYPGYPPNYYYPQPNYWYPQPQYPPPPPIYPGFYPPPQQNPQYPYPPYPGVVPGCEGAAGRCSCDAQCIQFNDCCSDYAFYCSGEEIPDSPFGTKTDGETCGIANNVDNGKCAVGLFCIATAPGAGSTCQIAGACTRNCGNIYQPLCGTDGFQYVNRCTFDIAKCQYSYLQIGYEGECRAPTVAPPTPPAGSCTTLRDCVSCTSVYQCVWDGRTCFQSTFQMPPPFVNVPSQCPVFPQQCPTYTDCVTCATAPGCTWFGTYCQYSQYPSGWPSDPRQCPVNPATCTTRTTCSDCTGGLNCFWSSTQNICVFSQIPLQFPYLSFPNQCPVGPTPNICSGQQTCASCAVLNGCSWSGSSCVLTSTPLTGCAQYGCANTVGECTPVVGG